VVVPTSNRASYLEVTLASIAAQDFPGEWETIVVDDASRDSTPAVIERFGVRTIRHDEPLGPNAGRNEATAAAHADLIALVDDDVYVPPQWLSEMVAGAERHPEADVLGGRIRARFDGPAPRSCGREAPPITALDLGDEDREVELVWSANLMFRRRAVELAGLFAEDIPPGGDEEEWLRRLGAAGGRVWYVADAWLDHRREGDDARLRSLMRGAYFRGRNIRSYDARRGVAPPVARELRVLAGCGWHTVRRGCPQGLIAGAHSWGRLREALRPGSTVADRRPQTAEDGRRQTAEPRP
jgi:glycosyltransferase involved in cell wall biosynthesis